MKTKTRCIGILTSGGDCPGLNAAIRGVAKAAITEYGMQVVGILDGFRGLVEGRTMPLDDHLVSGILTTGGTILGTSRDKPRKMLMGGEVLDMTTTAVANARRLGIDCLVCLGGGGTQKNALHLHREAGLDVLTLPKTIDNDVPETDVSFGFDTAMSIATEAIDRLHTTASSHQRLIICEVMGHNAGWLALGSGIAGGADVILIPEIPYDLDVISDLLLDRRRRGKRFSIVALAEGAHPRGEPEDGAAPPRHHKPKKEPPPDAEDEAPLVQESKASRLARHLQRMTGIEARVTSLGHVQRGGIPTPADRLLCTRLGAAAAELLARGVYNVMVAVKGDKCVPVPLDKVAGRKKTVPPDHPWIGAARLVGTCFGDKRT
ncbi:MAG: ATP-dependent 6-phosphofructokinase [Planctomycetota bacterium]|nr:ATP-dependent 6-phosphofructokinase [Planctomycetota bacterium]